MIGRQLITKHLERLEHALRDSHDDSDSAELTAARKIAADAIALSRVWLVSERDTADWDRDQYAAAYGHLVERCRKLHNEVGSLKLELNNSDPGDDSGAAEEIAALKKELSSALLDLRTTKKQRDDFADSLRQERRRREALEQLGEDTEWNDATQQRGRGPLHIPPHMVNSGEADAMLDQLEEVARGELGQPDYAGIFDGGIFSGEHAAFEGPRRRELVAAPSEPEAEESTDG